MHSPPSYKMQVKLSWKPAADSSQVTVKRPSLRTDQSQGVKAKTVKTGGLHMDRAVYAPPTGKFSEKAGTAPGNSLWGAALVCE